MSIECDFEGFKRLARDFMQAAPTARLDELDNGWKCLGLAYLGCKHDDTPLGRFYEANTAPRVLQMASKVFMQREAELLAAEAVEQGA